MATTSHIALLPLNTELLLVAQLGPCGQAAWRSVGFVVRTAEGLKARFLNGAAVCAPAWEQCLAVHTSAIVSETPIRFGVVLPGGRVEVIAQGELSNYVVSESRRIARAQPGALRGKELDALIATNKRWNEFLAGGRMRPLCSSWPAATRLAGRAAKPGARDVRGDNDGAR